MDAQLEKAYQDEIADASADEAEKQENNEEEEDTNDPEKKRLKEVDTINFVK